jgi:hypothetical protein
VALIQGNRIQGVKRWRINRNQAVSRTLRNRRSSNLGKERSARPQIQNEKEKDGVRGAKCQAMSNPDKAPNNPKRDGEP